MAEQEQISWVEVLVVVRPVSVEVLSATGQPQDGDPWVALVLQVVSTSVTLAHWDRQQIRVVRTVIQWQHHLLDYLGQRHYRHCHPNSLRSVFLVEMDLRNQRLNRLQGALV